MHGSISLWRSQAWLSMPRVASAARARSSKSIADAARGAGVPAAHLHEQRFDASVAAVSDCAFDVELRASRLRLRVEPGPTLPGQALAAGLFPGYDCQRGECGTCRTRVLDGRPDHRDRVQTAEEKASNSFMTIRCSHALSERIVLDL